MRTLKHLVISLLISAMILGSVQTVPAYAKKKRAKAKVTTTVSKKKKVPKTPGEEVVEYAKRFLGNPYRYGGTSLTGGTDCSGFTMKIFRHFGKRIPRTSSSQRSAGKRVKSLRKAKAGDLICYSGHVAIYMGKNKVIHASNPKDGIKITRNAAYRRIVCIRRIVK